MQTAREIANYLRGALSPAGEIQTTLDQDDTAMFTLTKGGTTFVVAVAKQVSADKVQSTTTGGDGLASRP